MSTPTPSVQLVGREFVRQYYTLLNKAPHHMHRFYSDQSVFYHQDFTTVKQNEAPVVGQKNIHLKFRMLNFQDCRTKIHFLDAQGTINQGVVLHVLGEMSNGGKPNRRFSQTIVLAEMSQKAYYVYNDIFRFLDDNLVYEYNEPSPVSSVGHPAVVDDDDFDGQSASEDLQVGAHPQRPLLLSSCQDDASHCSAAEPDISERAAESTDDETKGSYANLVKSGLLASADSMCSDANGYVYYRSPYGNSAGAAGDKGQSFCYRRGVDRSMSTDSRQVFVGNLPHYATEEDVANTFAQFGKVLEVRIGRNQPKISSTGQKLPNFGFVMFEEEKAIHVCLKARPISIFKGHRLNVEPKKPKNKSSDGATFYRGGQDFDSNRRYGGYSTRRTLDLKKR